MTLDSTEDQQSGRPRWLVPVAIGAGAVVLAAIVLPWSRAVGTPERNINWTFGLGAARTRLPAQRYLLQLFAGFVLVVFMPTHLGLQALFPPPP